MRRIGPAVLALALAAVPGVRADTLNVSADSGINQNNPNASLGDGSSVIVRRVGATARHGYVRFDLSPLASLPPGTPISRAVLRAWVGTGLNPGSVDVHPVLAPWDESTLTWNSAPALGTAIASVAIGNSDTLHYLTIDVTSVVEDWLDGTLSNEGLAFVPATDGVRLEMDSKENVSTSHPMELEVMPEGYGAGDITAVGTAAGSGLEGGATSGDTTLSLLTSCGAGEVLKWSGSTWACAADSGGTPSSGWSLTGNTGTTPGTNFIGTTDNQALELWVQGARAMRLEPNATSPNVVGGFLGNSVTAGVAGAVIGGGGAAGWLNRVSEDYGTVAGGLQNTASGVKATVGGGQSNVAGSDIAVVAGGSNNHATSLASTIGGGELNDAPGPFGTVPGGFGNHAGGTLSFAAGNGARVRSSGESGVTNGDMGTFVWADSPPPPSLGGHPFTSTGPNQFLIRAGGGVAINTNSPAAGSALTVSGDTTVTGNLAFGTSTRQMVNLLDTNYGIGVQSLTTYFRSDEGFAWFEGGTHSDAQNDPGGGQRQMRLDGAGNLFVQGMVSGGGADVADMLLAQEDVAPGDVLAIGPDGRLTLSTEPYQDSLAGVYSTKPGLVGGAADGEDLTGKIPLALSGVLPVKVTVENGPITPGDPLTSSSTPGRAMKAGKVRVGGVAFFPSGVILGKALEPLASGEGVIQALVVLQ